MADKPKDRVDQVAPPGDEPEPKVYLVVNGESFIRPSLESYYAQPSGIKLESSDETCSCNAVAGTFCQCNKVCSCNLVCTCQSFRACTCHGHADEQTRESCSCVGHKSPPRKSPSPGYGGGSYCSCNKVCTCVPVH